MPITVDILKTFPNPVFVETGTYKGDGIMAALGAGFEQIISIENDLTHVARVESLFGRNPKVMLTIGDSRYCLWPSIMTIEQPCTFWLDAHGDGPITPESSTVPEEIGAIRRHAIQTDIEVGHFVLINDMRLMPWLAPALMSSPALFGANASFVRIDSPRFKRDILVVRPDYR